MRALVLLCRPINEHTKFEVRSSPIQDMIGVKLKTGHVTLTSSI